MTFLRPWEAVILVLAVPAAIWAAQAVDPGLIYLLCEMLVIFLMAQMWNLLAGYAGLVSFGQQVFVGIGALALFHGANQTGIPLWVVLGLVPLAVGVAAIPLGLVMFQLKHAYFAVGMWVVAEIVQQLVLMNRWLGGTSVIVLRPGGSPLRGFPEQTVFIIAAVAAVALVIGLRVFLRTRLGLATLAMRDNEAAARGAGVDVRRLHLGLFCASAMGCALAGGLYYITTLTVSAATGFHISWAISMMVVTVIGGTGTLTGPALGTVVLIGLREAMTRAGWSGDQYWIVIGFVTVLTLLILPRGLWPALCDLTAKFNRPKAKA